MENAISIANYFIKKSQEDNKELTLMKLVKLTYISHGWYLALKNKELLGEPIQAWQYGPVVPSVYHTFKDYGSSQITKPVLEKFYTVSDKETKNFLDEVWDVYGRFTGIQLSSLTHEEGTPWYIVWNKMDGKKHTSAIIPNTIIKEHYVEKIKKPIPIE